jgi:hypothetical protein
MTISLENKKTNELIQITIRFKLSPKMFEVILASMAEKNPMGDIPTSFSYERQQEILKEFWNTCHLIWDNLYKQVPLKTLGTQMSFVDVRQND